MKTMTALLLILSLGSDAFAAKPPEYFCYGDDGSDLSISVDFKSKTATLNGEDVDDSYPMTASETQNFPAKYVFGTANGCWIQFTAYHDGKTGMATFGCNARKFPRALQLGMECSRQK